MHCWDFLRPSFLIFLFDAPIWPVNKKQKEENRCPHTQTNNELNGVYKIPFKKVITEMTFHLTIL